MTKERPDFHERQERDREIAAIRERLARLASEKAELEARLTQLLAAQAVKDSQPPTDHAPVTNASSPAAKIALFRSLFRGREDVFPKRWENTKTGRAGYAPACANEWAPRICGKPKIKCGDCPNRAFLPVTDEVIDGHLRGHHTVGVYPMLADETCLLLAADFDKSTWRNDAAAFLEACKARGDSGLLCSTAWRASRYRGDGAQSGYRLHILCRRTGTCTCGRTASSCKPAWKITANACWC
jgi:hypothetical protein